MTIGIRAIATSTVKSSSKGGGQKEIYLSFAGVVFHHEEYVYADSDGIIINPRD